MTSILLVKKFLGLVEMTSGLVNASFSLPEWQAVKMIFFAPWLQLTLYDTNTSLRNTLSIGWREATTEKTSVFAGLFHHFKNEIKVFLGAFPLRFCPVMCVNYRSRGNYVEAQILTIILNLTSLFGTM